MAKWKLNIQTIDITKLFILLSIFTNFNPLSANGKMTKGSALYKQACYACHDSGLVSAPRLGDKVAWKPRITQSIDTLTQTVISGKGAMPPRGGTQYTDAQIKQAIKFMLSKVK
ncbi:MAG: c-type cytochrome [Pseudomonadota bacterium]